MGAMNGPCWPFCQGTPLCPWDCPNKPKRRLSGDDPAYKEWTP